jgi:ParB/RepB/Spo0J family partition protein
MTHERRWITPKKSKGKKASHERRKKVTNPSARKAVGKDPGPADQTTAPSYVVREYAVDAIKVDVAKRRPVNPKTVKGLVESIKAIGLRTPLMVRLVNSVPHLVVGLQRLEAVKALGWKTVPCMRVRGGGISARKCKIAENLHRGELTKLERAEQTAEWLKLTETEEQLPEKCRKSGVVRKAATQRQPASCRYSAKLRKRSASGSCSTARSPLSTRL